MVLNLGAGGKLGRALLQQANRLLVDASLVENPAQRVRDVRVVGGGLLGPLGELERLLLVAAVLGVDHGQVVRGGGEAGIDRQGLLVRLRGMGEAALSLVYSSGEPLNRR